jgi:quercetin dioxygenase-like cupin family protein
MSSQPMPTDALARQLQRALPPRSATRDVQVLTEIPAGAQSGWQMHPGEEFGYILAGTVKVDVKGQPDPILHTGAGFLMPPRPRKRL